MSEHWITPGTRTNAYISLLHLIIMNEFLNLAVALSKNYWWLTDDSLALSLSISIFHWDQVPQKGWRERETETVNIKHYTKNRKRQSTNRTRKVANNQTQHTINCFRHGTHQTQSTVIVIIRYTNLARNTQMKTVKLRETFPFICWPCKVFSVSLSSSCSLV